MDTGTFILSSWSSTNLLVPGFTASTWPCLWLLLLPTVPPQLWSSCSVVVLHVFLVGFLPSLSHVSAVVQNLLFCSLRTWPVLFHFLISNVESLEFAVTQFLWYSWVAPFHEFTPSDKWHLERVIIVNKTYNRCIHEITYPRKSKTPQSEKNGPHKIKRFHSIMSNTRGFIFCSRSFEVLHLIFFPPYLRIFSGIYSEIW